MDEDNDLRVFGRMSKAERYKVHSDVVYAAPIENTLRKCDEIKAAAVVGVPADGTDGHWLIYCIV